MCSSVDFYQMFNVYNSIFRVRCEGGGCETVFLLSGHDQKIHLYKEVRNRACLRLPLHVDIFQNSITK